MKLKLNKATQIALKNRSFIDACSSDGFWYDLTDGGYFKSEDVLQDPKQIKEVHKAISLLKQLEEIYEQVTEPF